MLPFTVVLLHLRHYLKMVSIGTTKSKIKRNRGSEYFKRLAGLRKIRLKYKHRINHTICTSTPKDTDLNLSIL